MPETCPGVHLSPPSCAGQPARKASGGASASLGRQKRAVIFSTRSPDSLHLATSEVVLILDW